MKDASYVFTACRTLGHSWHVLGVEWSPDNQSRVMRLTCERCFTTRTDVVAPSGRLDGRNYTHSPAYKHDKQTRTEWRAELIEQLLKKGRRK